MTLTEATQNAQNILADDPNLTATSVVEEDGEYRVLNYDPADMTDTWEATFVAIPNVIAVYRR